MDKSEIDKWAKEYDIVVSKWPPIGTKLTTIDGSKIKVFVSLLQNKPPFLYALAFVPNTIGCKLNWHCVSIDSPTTKGLLCIVHHESKNQVIRKFGLSGNGHSCEELTVRAYTARNSALICDISKL